jgi:hypothetical protein
MQIMKRSLPTLLILLFFVLTATAQPMKNKFELGKKKKYRLVMDQWYNGKHNSQVVSVCELTTIKDSAAYYEEVRWLSLLQYKEKDTLLLDTLAAKVKPYLIALDSAGKMEIPPIGIPEMTQPIQDFTTFFVAISQQIGVNHLKQVGDIYEVPTTIKGDLKSGNMILKGEDCFRVKLQYVSKKRKVATIITSFEPPKENCLNYYLPEMSAQVVDSTINNIQMVMSSKDKFNIQWGREEFIIETRVNTSNGTLLSATMDNPLSFKMKMNCNESYKECGFEMPFKIVRKLKVELIK